MRSIPRALLVPLTLLCCVGCDQVSKSAARAHLSPGLSESFLADGLRLQLVENPGSFLSLGAALPESLRFALFVGMVAVVLVAIVAMALFARRLDAGYFLALALLGGGGISNLIDRLMNQGRVTDFLNVGIGAVRSGIFNVADLAILMGAVLIILKRGLPARAIPHG